ncbi:MAG: formate--tetrahydrofolate ligase [Bacilli bacterium]|nr:formate--tetrahydrofolate ligase [Bacilli bacterium]
MKMSDIDIAKTCVKKEITEVAKKIGLLEDNIDCYGKYKAKIKFNDIMNGEKGKLILVTAVNPTPYGEGKTTVSIGLVDAFNHLGKNAIGVLREPSLGPVFGLKGGATGGGYSQVVPMEDINLHFTGDLHAITSCNNLISAAIDNHIYQGNTLGIDPDKIFFKRCLDVNDRALRRISYEVSDGVVEHSGFNITAASEVMSVFCLSKDYAELREKLGNIMIAFDTAGNPIYVRDLNLDGALVTLLKDAFNPNLVQTLENNPVIIHGGPFANIAHGCNSIVATNLGLKLSDYVITEAGFGADLGAEKFMDIKCRMADLKPDCVVLTVTTRALKHNGGASKDSINDDNITYLQLGLPNLQVHIENLKKYTSHVIVALNKFATDAPNEIELIKKFVESNNVSFALCETYIKGGVGAVALADKIVEICDKENDFKLLYDVNSSIEEKIEKICYEIYHAGKITYSTMALDKIEMIKRLREDDLPICIAKTQYSISDDPKKLGYPKDYEVTVRDVELHTGAGFITVLLGSILTMPGLPKKPNYEIIDLSEDNEIVGLF